MTRRPVSPDVPLERLASLHGVQTSYVDADGVRREAAPDVLIAVLRSLGAPIDGPGDARSALAAGRRDAWDRPIEPVLVAWDGAPPPIRLRLNDSEPARGVRWTLVPEGSGTESSGRARLDGLRTTEAVRIDGARYVERELVLPGKLPRGYHHLHLEIGGRVGSR